MVRLTLMELPVSVVGRHHGGHVPRVRVHRHSRPEVGHFRRSHRRRLDREHEHRARRQQKAVSDERRGHPDVTRHESHLRDDGPVAGFCELCCFL